MKKFVSSLATAFVFASGVLLFTTSQASADWQAGCFNACMEDNCPAGRADPNYPICHEICIEVCYRAIDTDSIFQPKEGTEDGLMTPVSYEGEGENTVEAASLVIETR